MLLKSLHALFFVECHKSLKSCFDPKEAFVVLAYKLNYLKESSLIFPL
ncbi:hypothetical protein DB41_DT00120 [Neochlamydia sp. TUME1]|nr:hypothetical protein DB41_DT00120 [Neochlamydia sp. TUME1]